MIQNSKNDENTKKAINLRDKATSFGLSEEEFDILVDRIGRQPNALEAAIVGAMWSEHCGYKNSRPLFSVFPTTGKQVLQGPGENAGVVDIGEGYGVAFKMESHNHPSAVEPVQGAATGVGGILRDIFAMGARPFAVLDSLRFGNPESERTKFLVSGVVKGISHYGNAIGIPTVGGEITFHESYQENPLVNVMALGLLRHEDLSKGTMGQVGNQIIYVGSKTGRDGLGGAVFSSANLSNASDADRPAVQVGDPFMEKLLLEATLEAVKAGLVAGVQDMGAAGLVSSTCEMAYRANLGIVMDLNEVPTREANMVPMELCLSESQERMILVPVAGKEQELFNLLEKWELDVKNIGTVEEGDSYRLLWNGEEVCNLPVSLLNEAPKYTREGVENAEIIKKRNQDLSNIEIPKDWKEVLAKILANPNIASKKAIFTRYDHQVMTNTVCLPGQGDSAVLRIKDTNLGVAATSDCNPRFVYLDPYKGAVAAVAEATRNIVCVGAKPLAITDNLNFGNPFDLGVYYQLTRAVLGIADACKAFNTPVTGGNVSLYNQYSDANGEKIAIHPTPTIGMVGVLDDINKYKDKNIPDGEFNIYLLGETAKTIDASFYLANYHKIEAGQVPSIDFDLHNNLLNNVLDCFDKNLVIAAHDISEGGLAVAITEMLSNRTKGLDIVIDESKEIRPDALLFGETQSSILLAIDKNKSEEFEKNTTVPFKKIATTAKHENINFKLINHDIEFNISLEESQNLYNNAFNNILS